MKSRKAAAIQRLHRQHQRLQPVRQVAAEGRDQRAEQRQDQHPEQHRALVVAPDAGDLVEERLRRMRILDDVERARNRRRRRRGSARRRRGRRAGTASTAAGARDRHQPLVAAQRADQRHGRLDKRQRERQHQGEMAEFGDHRAHRLSASALRLPLSGLPATRPASSAPRRPPSACSSRRAWRAPCRRRRSVAVRSCPRRPRPAPRGRGPAGCRDRRP